MGQPHETGQMLPEVINTTSDPLLEYELAIWRQIYEVVGGVCALIGGGAVAAMGVLDNDNPVLISLGLTISGAGAAMIYRNTDLG